MVTIFAHIILLLSLFVARSPLFSHISATLQGLTTIRSFRKGSSFLDQFHHYQNEHTKGWYLYVASSRLFGMRIDLFVAVYLTIVSFAAVPLASCKCIVHCGTCSIALVVFHFICNNVPMFSSH